MSQVQPVFFGLLLVPFWFKGTSLSAYTGATPHISIPLRQNCLAMSKRKVQDVSSLSMCTWAMKKGPLVV